MWRETLSLRPTPAPASGTPAEISVPSFVQDHAEESTGADRPIADTSPLQLRELQQLLRERTEELDQLRWRMEQQNSSADESVVMILNQQLADSRDENKRLREKIALHNAAAAADDLTQLKGIGDKLVEQLADAGITELKQIAKLDLSLLEAEDHPLHSLRSRIVRDEWIEQAQAALAGKA